MRTLSSYLLTALLLACPYLCWGDVVCATGVSTSGCRCSCDEQNVPMDEDAPGHPEEGASDCLCQGAVVNGLKSVELEVSVIQAAQASVGTAYQPATDVALAIRNFEPSHHFPPHSCGRDICALTCALLI